MYLTTYGVPLLKKEVSEHCTANVKTEQYTGISGDSDLIDLMQDDVFVVAVTLRYRMSFASLR
jgi:hypothetical protein